MRSEDLQIGSLEVEVTFKPIKNLHLSVHPPDGRITVSSPDFFDLEKIKVYLITKLAWIKKEQAKIRSQAREEQKLMITQESHQFLGKRYLLKVTVASRPKIILKHNTIELHALAEATWEQKKRTLENWYKKELMKKIVHFFFEYSEKMDLTDLNFGIRKMKTKWGSCNIEKRMLWFNIELAKKPLDSIEYIVVHELVHLLERNHNKRFVLLMDKYLPTWRTQKKVLNELPI